MNQLDKHINVISILHIVFSAPPLLAALIVFVAVAGGGLLSGEVNVIAITSLVAISVSGLLIILSLPGFIVGIGLLKRQAWARIAGLIVGFLELMAIPFGTVLGIYTVIILMKDESEEYFTPKKQLKKAG